MPAQPAIAGGRTFQGPSGGGVGPRVGAKLSLQPAAALGQLAGGGYAWPVTEYDDAGFVTDLGGGNLGFTLPSNGDYRILAAAYVFPLAGDPAVGFCSAYVQGGGGLLNYSIGMTSLWNAGASKNVISGGGSLVLEFSGSAGDVWAFNSGVSTLGPTDDTMNGPCFFQIEKTS